MKQEQKQQLRSVSRDSPRKKITNIPNPYTYGQLTEGEVKCQTKKFTLKTFFGNPDYQVFCIKFDWEDQYLVAGCQDGTVKLFNLVSGKLDYNLQGSSDGQSPTTCIRWRKDVPDKNKGVFITANADGSIMYWHAETGKQLHRMIEQDNQILCLDIRNQGDLFATAGKDAKIRIYDDEEKKIIKVFEQADYHQFGHNNRVFSVKFLDDNPDILISGGWDGNILIWDIRTSKSVGHIFGPCLTGDSLDYKNQQILTGSYRSIDQLELWDFKTLKLLKQIYWSEDKNQDDYYLYCCQFSKYNNDTIMAGCSGRQELKIFDINSDYQCCLDIQDLQGGVYSCDYSNKSNKLAFGGGEGIVYICSLSNSHHHHHHHHDN